MQRVQNWAESFASLSPGIFGDEKPLEGLASRVVRLGQDPGSPEKKKSEKDKSATPDM
jgi:hypothetical protein